MLIFLQLMAILFSCASAQEDLIEVGSFGNKVFYLYSRPFATYRLQWADAKQICETNDLTLAKIENEAENEFIQYNTPLDETYWIGGMKPAGISLNFNWDDGRRVEFSNFRETPIINTGRNPTYIAVNNGVWIQSFSFISDGFGAICQGEADLPTSSTTSESSTTPSTTTSESSTTPSTTTSESSTTPSTTTSESSTTPSTTTTERTTTPSTTTTERTTTPSPTTTIQTTTTETSCRAEAFRMVNILRTNPPNYFQIFMNLQNHLARCRDPALDREVRAALANVVNTG